MIADSPIIVYDKVDKNGSRKHSKKEIDNLMKRWEEKKKKEEEQGTKLNMNDFLRTDMRGMNK